MNLENLLSFPIQALQGVVFTPISLLITIFSFMLLLSLYHWSGLAEKVENLTGVKKFIVLIFVALIVFVSYYVFYKAGMFDKIISNSTFKMIIEKIGGLMAY